MKGEVPDGEHVVAAWPADVKRPGWGRHDHLPSKTWPRRSRRPKQLAAEEVERRCSISRTIRPLDTEAMLASVTKTHRCVVAERGAVRGVGAQVEIRSAGGVRRAPIAGGPGNRADVPMPYNKHLEKREGRSSQDRRRGALGAVRDWSHGYQSLMERSRHDGRGDAWSSGRRVRATRSP